MTDHEEKKEAIKDSLHMLAQLEANIENWTYVRVNAEYLPNKQVADALEQVLGLVGPMLNSMRSALEVEALTTLDPIDLI